MDTQETNQLIELAVNGDSNALELLLLEAQDTIFNLSLRMLGTVADAEDATQDILIRIMTNLSSFRMESSFHTWVYRISLNSLINYKKSMFSNHPLSFEYYGQDISSGFIPNSSDLLMDVDENLLAEELKMSCTNVMLQCLDPQSRCIFILGTMFKVDSRIAGDILDMTAENYRQRLSRIRHKMADFLSEYCGHSKTGSCNCKKRIGYAIQSHRLNPKNLEYHSLREHDKDSLMACKKEMEIMDDLSMIFDNLKKYKSNLSMNQFIQDIVHSSRMKSIQEL